MKILVASLFLGILIFVHELGHFLVAKAFRVGVPVFSFGFGRRLFGFEWRGTDYRVSLIPFGGYVRLQGADPFDEPEDELEPVGDDEHSMLHKPVWQRLLIYLAGPAFNLVLPYFLFVTLLVAGEPQPGALVGMVLADSPAAEAGVLPGDEILAFNGVEVDTWYQVLDAWDAVSQADDPVELRLHRGDGEHTLRVTPRSGAGSHEPRLSRRVGILNDIPSTQVGVDDPRSAAGRAGLRTGDMLVSVNTLPVEHWLDVERILMDTGDSVTLTVMREGERLSFTLERAAKAQDEAVGAQRWGLASATMFVARVSAGSPAERAGLEAGDHLVAIDGTGLHSWVEVLDLVSGTELSGGEEGHARSVVVSVIRGGERLDLPVQPTMLRDTDALGRYYYRPIIGITRSGDLVSAPTVKVYYSLGDALVIAGRKTLGLVRFTLEQVGRILTGEVAPQESIGGPVEIMRQATKAAERGLFDIAELLGMISISVGIFNLLPVPVLDGGNILFSTIEAVRGRPVSILVKERAQMVGVMLLVALMLFVLVVDVNRLFSGG